MMSIRTKGTGDLVRTLILLLTIGAAFGLYQTRRAASIRASMTTSALSPPPPPTGPVIEPAAQEPRQTPDALAIPTVPPPHADEEPLTPMEKEVLREARSEWQRPPHDLIERVLPEEEAILVATISLRAALREMSARRWGPTPDPDALQITRIHLRPRGAVTLRDPAWKNNQFVGMTSDGSPLAIPASSIVSLEPLPRDEAEERWRLQVEERIGTLTGGGADTRTAEILWILYLGDLSRAESRLGSWIENDGPIVIAAQETDPARRAYLEECAARLAEAPAEEIASSLPFLTDPEIRNLPSLTEFLTRGGRVRELDNEGRLARAEQCLLWTAWLEKQENALPIPRDEISALRERLRLLRYDLLKGTGF